MSYEKGSKPIEIGKRKWLEPKKELIGVDIFLDWKKGTPDALGDQLIKITEGTLSLDMVTNRGVKVYQTGFLRLCTNHWKCRWISKDETPFAYSSVLALQTQVSQAGFDVIKTENLYKFDGNVNSLRGEVKDN